MFLIKEEILMIEIRHLTKKYGSHVAVDNLDLTVEKGKIYGFLGPNGAGKSTTMNMITGYLAPTEGEVIIDGHTYIVEDCGGAIKGNRVDFFFDTHEEALKFGRQEFTIWVKEAN